MYSYLTRPVFGHFAINGACKSSPVGPRFFAYILMQLQRHCVHSVNSWQSCTLFIDPNLDYFLRLRLLEHLSHKSLLYRTLSNGPRSKGSELKCVLDKFGKKTHVDMNLLCCKIISNILNSIIYN